MVIVYPVALVAASASPGPLFFLTYLTSQAATKTGFRNFVGMIFDPCQKLVVPRLNFNNAWEAVTRSNRLNDAGAPYPDIDPLFRSRCYGDAQAACRSLGLGATE